MGQRRLVVLGIVAALLALGAKAQDSGSTIDGAYAVFADLKFYQDCDMWRYEKNFLGSLNYEDCSEIVECGLAQVVMIKLAQPRNQLKKLEKRIDELIIDGETADVRYKAYLASVVFDRPELFNSEKYGSYVDGDGLFRAIAERLQKQLLARN